MCRRYIFMAPVFFIPGFALVAPAGCVSPPPAPALEPSPVVRTAKLFFIGDVMSHSPQVAAAKTPTGYDYTEVFLHFSPIFGGEGGNGGNGRSGSDEFSGTDCTRPETVTIANLETTLRTGPPYTGYPAFAAPAQLAFAMREAGIGIVTTANNHILDKGAAGVRSTLAILDSARLRHTGVFLDSVDRQARNPLRFVAGGLHFALFAYTYGTNGISVPKGVMVNMIDTALIARDLGAIRPRAGEKRGEGGSGSGPDPESGPDPDTGPDPDCIIVCYHWGEEYRSAPTRAQRELAAWTHARGADLVIGGHPHVVEPIEAHWNADSTAVAGATYYSLGNFVSNQSRRGTDGGIAAEITLTRVDSLPLRYDPGWRLAWVHTFWRDGVRRYTVLPAAALDTLPEPAASAAGTFVRDTRRLLSADSLFMERQ